MSTGDKKINPDRWENPEYDESIARDPNQDCKVQFLKTPDPEQLFGMGETYDSAIKNLIEKFRSSFIYLYPPVCGGEYYKDQRREMDDSLLWNYIGRLSFGKGMYIRLEDLRNININFLESLADMGARNEYSVRLVVPPSSPEAQEKVFEWNPGKIPLNDENLTKVFQRYPEIQEAKETGRLRVQVYKKPIKIELSD